MKIIRIPPFIKGRPVARRSGFFINGKDDRWSFLVVFGWTFPWIHVWKGKMKGPSEPPPPDHPNCRCATYPVVEKNEDRARVPAKNERDA